MASARAASTSCAAPFGRALHRQSPAQGRGAAAASGRRPLRSTRLAAFHLDADPALASLTAERSVLINKEVVLFLFQLEMDSQLQRALTYERFDMAQARPGVQILPHHAQAAAVYGAQSLGSRGGVPGQQAGLPGCAECPSLLVARFPRAAAASARVQEVRARRQQVDSALRELQQLKGPGCGARVAGRSDQVEFAPQIMTLKAQLSEAVESEKYDEAAALRDRLRQVEEAAAAAADAASQYLCPVDEPRFTLGEMVVHNSKGYRGVVCGWDMTCCEGSEWQEAAGVSKLRHGTDQVFYHVLVDARDWPPLGDQPPVAYVAEELLTAGSSADFTSDQPLVDGSFEHPYSYLLFLGADGQGNMVPARQLRDKYCVDRRDVYCPGESRWEDDAEEDGGDDGPDRGPTSGGGGGGEDGPRDDRIAGRRSIPGIDMSSLD
ncbi:hypothetical protein ABPG75_009046 [Micractinium tetrahymenae]